MFDERAFIAQVESSGTEELANLLKHPTLDQEKALRAHLGDARYQRMHSMALKKSTAISSASRSVSEGKRGNVVVIHGIMGGELTTTNRGGAGEQVWVKAFRIMTGWLTRLRLGEDGYSDYDPTYTVRATGIMKRYYGELLLSLSERWNVRAFWFDWRKDLKVAASELDTQIGGWFGEGAPVHIVAHSMGGLVARTFIQKFPERWASMKDGDDMKLGGRLVMLGTPNQGSFAIPQVITGIEGLVRKLTLLDIRHNSQQLSEVFNSFVGSYQMLPSPNAMPEMGRLYDAGTYRGYNVPQAHLDTALKQHEFIRKTIDPDRMFYIAGADQPTYNGIKSDGWDQLNSLDAYTVTRDGDGRVPHALGLLSLNGREVPTYYIREEHGGLSTNPQILAALDGLLQNGKTNDLSMAKIPASRGLGSDDARRELDVQLQSDLDQLNISRSRMGTRAVNPTFVDNVNPTEADEDAAAAARSNTLSPEERKVEESLTRGFLSTHDEARSATDMADDERPPSKPIEIEIGLVLSGIERVHEKTLRGVVRDPVDAIAVGHYIGVQPQNAERALDLDISKPLPGKVGAKVGKVDDADLILTQYTNRGIIHGRLGQPFFLPDPRQHDGNNGKKSEAERVLAIVGMGESGRFGVPELTVMVRELCWSLGRMGKRHLATVIIGAGAGNIPHRDAVAAWIDGVKRAVTGSADDDERRLHRITFVEYDPRFVRILDQIIDQELQRKEKANGEILIHYQPLTPAELTALGKEEEKKNRAEWKAKQNAPLQTDQRDSRQPTRVTLSLEPERKIYRFGAITANASVPERETKIDPALVWQANDELAGEQRHAMQLERGRFLEQLLMPDDLRRELYSNAPLVMMLDSTTARIHWEMVAQPEVGALGSNLTRQDAEFDEINFLGTSRGFTRQLRTTFAPPPEPPPPPRRVLRVLVVADPAADAHLPGAQEEGVAVADLFESYNTVYKDNADSRVEVVRLFGPLEATRTNVLRELMVRSYDVLHFAGHCVFQWGGDPTLSGWVFNVKNKELLSANELNRIDRIPKFVFSNACESGITPDRSQDRTVELAPSFAEAFFARGVSNFVCTAWPVNDVAARTFALSVYSALLGIEMGQPKDGDDEGATIASNQPRAARPMHAAMREARVGIASTPDGTSTWGAYQHYGNPYFQLFNTQKSGASNDSPRASRKSSASRAKPKPMRAATKKKSSRKR
jgi:pimeloyl-ACP methyl ester carboxylesterase